jgi:hypothetical protein
MDMRLFLASLCAAGALFSSVSVADECRVSRGLQVNEALEVGLPANGRFVFRPGGQGFVDRDGALGIKVLWRRLVEGQLIVGGRRLDGEAQPARAYMSKGYPDSGIRPTYLVFPTPGCWEVTGRIGDKTLTFVVYVEKVGDGPSWRYEQPSDGSWYQTTL